MRYPKSLAAPVRGTHVPESGTFVPGPVAVAAARLESGAFPTRVSKT